MTALASISAFLIWTLIVLMVLKYAYAMFSFTVYQMQASGIHFGKNVLVVALIGTIINMVRIPYLYVKVLFIRFVLGLK
jgi:hypothetical protein